MYWYFWVNNKLVKQWLNNYGLWNINYIGKEKIIVQEIFITKRKVKGRSEDYLSDRDTSPYSHTSIINEIIT